MCGHRAGHLAHDVHHVRVALDFHVAHDAHAAHARDAAHVVASEVDEHHVLGALFLVGEELALERRVFFGRGAAAARSGDGAHRHVGDRVLGAAPTREVNERLGARAGDLRARRPRAGRRQIEEVHVRRRVHETHRAVDVERIAPARGTENVRARTIWNASPAAMYSCARRTAFSNLKSSIAHVDGRGELGAIRQRDAARDAALEISTRARGRGGFVVGGDRHRLRRASRRRTRRSSEERAMRSPTFARREPVDLRDAMHEVPRKKPTCERAMRSASVRARRRKIGVDERRGARERIRRSRRWAR